ncbi:MAG: hypothetical protein ACI9PP_000720, partial [Halobacteriales archaeon]
LRHPINASNGIRFAASERTKRRRRAVSLAWAGCGQDGKLSSVTAEMRKAPENCSTPVR